MLNKSIQFIDGLNVNFLQDSDNKYIAYFEKIPDISAFANRIEDSFEELKIAWECAKETSLKFGIPIPYRY